MINGEEFFVEPGCVSWIQCSQVLTVCPDFGNNLVLWICPYDYQLLSYYSFSNIAPTRELEIVNNLPVIGPDGDEVKDILTALQLFEVPIFAELNFYITGLPKV